MYTLVRPGKSTRSKSTTFLEKNRNFNGTFERPLFFPATLSVSVSINFLTSSKSENFSFFLS